MRISRRLGVSNFDQTRVQYGTYTLFTKAIYLGPRCVDLAVHPAARSDLVRALADLKQQVFQLLRAGRGVSEVLVVSSGERKRFQQAFEGQTPPHEGTDAMKILVAEDDAVSRRMLEVSLEKWGYAVVVAVDGAEAWRVLQDHDPPDLAILDWMMPAMDGIEVCRKARESLHGRPIYIILLTARGSRVDLVTGLEAGADDYITKPFDAGELRARVSVGARVVELQKGLATRVQELEEALTRVKQLQGLLPICSYCKKIRDDRNYWQQVDSYIAGHSAVQFSHGICPDCYTKIVEPELEKMNSSGEPTP